MKLKNDVKDAYNSFITLYDHYRVLFDDIDNKFYESKNYNEMVTNATNAASLIINYSNEVENYLNSFEHVLLSTEEYINQAKKRHIGILDYDQLYELYDNLRYLKSYIASLSSARSYINIRADYIDKSKLKQLEISSIRLRMQYYKIEQRIIQILLSFD